MKTAAYLFSESRSWSHFLGIMDKKNGDAFCYSTRKQLVQGFTQKGKD